MKRLFHLSYLLLLPLLAHGALVPAGSSNHEILIQKLYASFCADKLWFHPEEMGKFLTKPLLRDMVKAEKADLYLDLGCPFAPSQDPDYKEIARTLTVKAESTTTIVATFETNGKKAKVSFQCRKEDGQWRVDDIVEDFEGHPHSFAKALRSALAQPAR